MITTIHFVLLLLLLLLMILCPPPLSRAHGLEPPLIGYSSSHTHEGFGSTRGVVSVAAFGAVGNGLCDDTQAFKEAWHFACSSPSGLVLEISAGYVYLVRPISFGGPCKSKLTLLVLGTIIAPSDPDVWKGLNPHRWLYFHGINQLVVRGTGTINGMGQRWWERSCKINKTNVEFLLLANIECPCRHAPTAVTFHRSKHVLIQELTLKDSQQMHLAFTDSSHVKATQLKVIAPAASPNTDGIHISESVSVVIEDCLIKTGDDCISIVSNSSNILIKNIECGPGHGISIGSLGKSHSWSQVHNVMVDGAVLSNTENGARIKTWQGGRGYAQDIFFSNMFMRNVSNPIIIDQYYCDSPHECQNKTAAVKVDRISFISIKGTSATENAIKFACSDSFPCENIFLKDIHLSLYSRGEPSSYCWKAFGFSSGSVRPPSCLSGDDYVIGNDVSSSLTKVASTR